MHLERLIDRKSFSLDHKNFWLEIAMLKNNFYLLEWSGSVFPSSNTSGGDSSGKFVYLNLHLLENRSPKRNFFFLLLVPTFPAEEQTAFSQRRWKPENCTELKFLCISNSGSEVEAEQSIHLLLRSVITHEHCCFERQRR